MLQSMFFGSLHCNQCSLIAQWNQCPLLVYIAFNVLLKPILQSMFFGSLHCNQCSLVACNAINVIWQTILEINVLWFA